MTISPSEYYTYQFYAWEYRGRGWFLADQPIHLEPPFEPFRRVRFNQGFVDDGKRHTLVSWALEAIKGKPKTENNTPETDYESIEPYVFERSGELRALQIKVPKERKITQERMKALMVMLSGFNEPLSFELIATRDEITIQFVCSEISITAVEIQLRAYFPELTFPYSDKFLDGILDRDLYTTTVDFGLEQEFFRPLQTARNFNIDPLTAIFGILENIGENEQAGIQILFQGVVNNWTESIVRSVTFSDGDSFFEDSPQAPKLALEKISSPLFGVTMRVFAQARGQEQSIRIIERLCQALQSASVSPTNQLVPLVDEIYDFELRTEDILLRQSHRLGMLLNTEELINLLHFPSESISSKKLFRSSRKTKETPAIAKGKQFILGKNTHNGADTEVSFGLEDRLKHTHIIGATGTGKSTLIANLVSQDITQGLSLVLFDPHGDLIDDVIARISREKLADVVLIDPADTEYPIGLNILEAHSDTEKEVLSSDLVASFRRYATTWGDQMNAVLGNAIQAILESSEGGTLNDLRRFLIEKDFRQGFLKKVQDPATLYYWKKEYPLLKSNSIGPILTRLDTFLRPRSIRNMVIQKKGIDFEALLNQNKIILLKLSQGLIGAENSYILGSLILSKIHQAMFRRQGQQSRKPVMIYLDEFQNFITPSIKDMLSGIRKYNVGLTLSHQDLMQLQRQDSELLNSVLGNINTRIVFRVGEPDAKKLQDGFSDFNFTDLQNLGRGEAVIRIEQPQYDCSLDTYAPEQVPSEKREANIKGVIFNTRGNYATPREEIEKLLIESYDLEDIKIPDEPKPTKPKQVVEQKEKQEPKAVPAEQHKEEPVPEVKPEPEPKVERDVSTHRYLQTLVKKMAEARGYTATIEQQLADGLGQVDVLLAKDGATIAIEICNTTNPDWEAHNIQKCLEAGYHIVISLSGDPRQLDKIKKKCQEQIPEFETKPVLFLTPDTLFAYLDDSVKQQEPQKENIIKGYRVNVTYDSISHEEMQRKRAAVAEVVFNSLRKKKK